MRQNVSAMRCCIYAPIDFNHFKIQFNCKGPCSFSARGYWSATQESLRSTALAYTLRTILCQPQLNSEPWSSLTHHVADPNRSGGCLDVILTRWLTSASIRQIFLIISLLLPPSHFFAMSHPILPDKTEVGGISPGMPSEPCCLKCQQLQTHPSWLTSNLLTSLQSMAGSFQCAQPEFIDPHFHHDLMGSDVDLTFSVDLSATRLPNRKIISTHQVARWSLCVGTIRARYASPLSGWGVDALGS